jgi:hypothetical protein
MSSQPYQPLLLRILHGLSVICLILAILTAFWTYNTYDGRFGKLPLPDYAAIEGIHGTFGLYTLLIFPLFLWYAFHRGQRRLVQADSFKQLGQLDRPTGWYALNRIANTTALVALAFALFSGKMMDSAWLPQGELDHAWYTAHLMSWVVMVGAIALHLLMNAKVGGLPLLQSMWQFQFRTKDHPRRWPSQIAATWQQLSQSSAAHKWQMVRRLPALELALWLSWAAAWIISLTKEVFD